MAEPSDDGRGQIPAGYQGFGVTSRLIIVLFGFLVAALSLYSAWQLVDQTQVNTQITPDVFGNIPNQMKTADPNEGGKLTAYVISVYTLLKIYSAKQQLMIVMCGGSFALFAIGFTLFVIGADGAFQVQASTKNSLHFTFSASAPGLLCFALGAAMMMVGMTQTVTMAIPPNPYVTGDQGGGAECAKTPNDPNCMTLDQLKAMVAPSREQ